MEDNLKSFQESIPGKYELYLGPYIFEPFASYTANRIKNFARDVLEIAAGTGRVSRHIREKIKRGAKFTATDINPSMLNIARKNLQNLDINFCIADAQAIPYPDNSFDVVICQFGFMFLPDRQKGFNEAWRVLKPGGQFLFTTWDKPEHNITYHISHHTIIDFLKEAPPVYFGRPYSMFDPAELKSHMELAGFVGGTIEKVTLTGECPSAMDAAKGFVEGNSIVKELLKEGQAYLDLVEATIASKIKMQVGSDPVRSELNAWLGEAFK